MDGKSALVAAPILLMTFGTHAFNQVNRFIAASGFSNLADGIAVVAWAWLASLLTRDAFLIALLPLALRLPWFLFSIPAGIVTDKVDRRRLILAMDLVRASLFLGLTIAVILSMPLLPAPDQDLAQPLLFVSLLSGAFIIGAAEVFRDNAAQTYLPSLVDAHNLEKANGRLFSVELVANMLLGPAMGAFLLGLILWVPFALKSVLLLMAFLTVMSLGRGKVSPPKNVPTPAPQEQVTGSFVFWFSNIKPAWVFLHNQPLLKLLAIATGVWNLLFHMVSVTLLLHMQENFGTSVETYGLVLSGGAVGGILGGLCAPWMIQRFGQGRTAVLMLYASLISFFALLFAPNAFAIALVLLFFEFTGLIWNTLSVSYRQRLVPDFMLGRVNSLYRLLAWGSIPLGLMSAGLMVEWTSLILPRSEALLVPLGVAALGALVLSLACHKSFLRLFPA